MLSLSLIRERSSGNCLCYLHRSGLHSRSTVGKHTLFMVVVKIMKNRVVAWGGGGITCLWRTTGGFGGYRISPSDDRPSPKQHFSGSQTAPPTSGSTTEIEWVAGKYSKVIMEFLQTVWVKDYGMYHHEFSTSKMLC